MCAAACRRGCEFWHWLRDKEGTDRPNDCARMKGALTVRDDGAAVRPCRDCADDGTGCMVRAFWFWEQSFSEIGPSISCPPTPVPMYD